MDESVVDVRSLAYICRVVVELQRLIDDANETVDVLEMSRHFRRQHHVNYLLSQHLVVIPARTRSSSS